MTKGFTSKPKDCIFCGEPLPIPRNSYMKRHAECAETFYKIYNQAWSKHKYMNLSTEEKQKLIKKRTEQRRNTPDIIKESINLKNRKRSKQIRIDVINHYGGKCACCSESILEFLSIDHIDGGGKKHRKEIGGGGNTFYRWLIRNNFPEGFRVLCNNCNMSIGFYGYCPHQIKSEKNF